MLPLVRATLWVCLFAFPPFNLWAQEVTIERVTDLELDAGSNATPEMVVLADVGIYTYFNWVGTGTNNSAVALLNPETGEYTQVLDERGEPLPYRIASRSLPPLMAIGAYRLAYLPDPYGTNGLYLLEGNTATLLASMELDELSAPTEHDGKIYWLQNNRIHATEQFNNFDMDLWVTDGTPEGTGTVARLPGAASFFDGKLLTTDFGVVIVANNINESQHFLFHPESQEVENLNISGSSVLSFQARQGQTSAYFAGSLITVDGNSREGVRLNTIDMASRAVSRIDVAIEAPAGLNLQYVQLISDQDRLALMLNIEDEGTFVFAAQSSLSTGLHLVNHTDGADQDFGKVFPTPMVLENNELLFFTHYASGRGEVLRYRYSNGAVQRVLSFPDGGYRSGEIVVSEGSLFFADRSANKIYYLLSSIGLQSSTSIALPSYQQEKYRLPLPVIARNGNSILFAGASSNSGDKTADVYRLSATTSGLQSLTAGLPAQVKRNTIRTRSHRLNVLIKTPENHYTLNLENENTVMVAPLPEGLSLVRELLLPDHLILEVINDNTGQRSIFFVNPDGSLYSPTIQYEGEVLTDYFFDLINGMDNLLICRFDLFPTAAFWQQRACVVEITEDNNLRVRTGGIYDQIPNLSALYINRSGVTSSLSQWENLQANLVIDVWSENDESYRFLDVWKKIPPEGAYVQRSPCGNESEFQSSSFQLVPKGFPERPIPICQDLPVYPTRFFFLTHDINGRVVMEGNSPDFGNEYYVADPVTGRLSLLLDIFPGTQGGEPRFAGRSGTGVFYFTAHDGIHGRELWVTDGTTDGTYMVYDLNPGTASSFPGGGVAYQGYFYFSAVVEDGRELYRVALNDPTAVPELVDDLNPGRGSSFPSNYRLENDNLYFTAYEGPNAPLEYYRLNSEDNFIPTETPDDLASFRVSPNPVIGATPFLIEVPEGENVVTLDFVNAYGAVVRRLDLFQQSITSLTFEGLPAGMYWLRANYESGRTGVTPVLRYR
jgi:ELWxxDGT repeat protein